MIALPLLLVAPAEKAGMRVPPDPEDFDPAEYPHFEVYCAVQLGAPMPSPSSHWSNAKVVAAVSDELIRRITLDSLLKAGLDVGFPAV